MGFMKAEVWRSAANILGEGPLWDHSRGELCWVDIEQKLLCFSGSQGLDIELHHLSKKIGFAAPTARGTYILGLQDGLYEYDRTDKSCTLLHQPPETSKETRWNDGKCAPDGSIWGGTMSVHQKPALGHLYQLDTQGRLIHMMDGIGISNGLAWNMDLERMYYIDTWRRSVQVFRYDTKTQTKGDKLHEWQTDESMGYPDGMTIDEDGMLWISHWDGHCVARWHPETGQLISKIDVPAGRVTSCTFGGPDMSTLYITTARKSLDEELLKQYPYSGHVFTADTLTRGLHATFYNGPVIL